jgi:hypothetical protein
MKANIVRLGTVALLVGLLLAGTLIPAAASDPAAATYQGRAAARLNAEEVTALNEAINEEYLAFNTYGAVISQFGVVLPFSNVVSSEQQHVAALANLFTKYGLAVPANPGLEPVPAWTTLKAACQTGVDVEIADAALYDGLLPVTKKADLIRVFTNLQSASLDSHLPAFEACN